MSEKEKESINFFKQEVSRPVIGLPYISGKWTSEPKYYEGTRFLMVAGGGYGCGSFVENTETVLRIPEDEILSRFKSGELLMVTSPDNERYGINPRYIVKFRECTIVERGFHANTTGKDYIYRWVLPYGKTVEFCNTFDKQFYES